MANKIPSFNRLGLKLESAHPLLNSLENPVVLVSEEVGLCLVNSGPPKKWAKMIEVTQKNAIISSAICSVEAFL